MGTTVLIDVDGVLAKSNVPVLMATYARNLRLSLPDIPSIRTRDAFHTHPQVVEYRKNVGDRRYQEQLAILEWDPRYVAQLLPFSGAVEGVQQLASLANECGYCTARVISFSEEWNKDLALATHRWLRNQGFPKSEQVLFCDGIQAKLEAIAAQLLEDPALNIVLIDDSVESLFSAFKRLRDEEQQVLKQRFTLIGFGFDGVILGPLSVISLPDWSDVGEIMPLLQGERGNDYAMVGKEKQR